jgi:hypothetical protein
MFKMKYRYRWRARFEIISQLLKPQCTNCYYFKKSNENGKMCIDVVYDTFEEDGSVTSSSVTSNISFLRWQSLLNNKVE